MKSKRTDRKINFYQIFKDYIPEISMSKKQIITKCIFHTDKKPSLSINLEKGIYFCFSCGVKGNHWDFLKYVEPESKTNLLMEKYYA